MDSRAHVFITGRVQGVFFRANTKKTAQKQGLSGWVKNLSDGRVEAVFEGPKNAVSEMVRWCHEGPIGANVESVEVKWEDPIGLMGFEITF